MVVSITLADWCEKEIDVSSANKRERLVRLSVMSLIYKRKSRRHKTEPWGTPALVGLVVEETL